MKIKSDAVVIVNPTLWTATVTEVGEETHLGRFTSEGSATAAFDDQGVFFLHYLTDWTAANGDILHLEGKVYGLPDGGFTMNFWVIGGTGRFEGATGGWGDDVTPYYSNVVVDPDTGLIINTFSYKITGTITY